MPSELYIFFSQNKSTSVRSLQPTIPPFVPAGKPPLFFPWDEEVSPPFPPWATKQYVGRPPFTGAGSSSPECPNSFQYPPSHRGTILPWRRFLSPGKNIRSDNHGGLPFLFFSRPGYFSLQVGFSLFFKAYASRTELPFFFSLTLTPWFYKGPFPKNCYSPFFPRQTSFFFRCFFPPLARLLLYRKPRQVFFCREAFFFNRPL